LSGGITIGGGIAVGQPSTPPAPSGTTYTSGVDFSTGGVVLAGSQSAIFIFSGDWITTGWQDIITNPSSTIFTFTLLGEGALGTATLTSAFVDIGGAYRADISTAYSLPGVGYAATITFPN
jgi:hypothetical protein